MGAQTRLSYGKIPCAEIEHHRIAILRLALIACFFFQYSVNKCIAQLTEGEASFQHLSVADGLNDLEVNAICEDQYGLIWFSTLGALNRFDGTQVQRFIGEPGDSTTPYPGVAYEMAQDNNGQLWIGYTDGLVSYDDRTGVFHMPESMRGIGPYQIVPGTDGLLYIASNGKLHVYNPLVGELVSWDARLDDQGLALLSDHRISAVVAKGNWIHAGTNRGIIKFNTSTREIGMLDLPDLTGSVSIMAADPENGTWISDATNYQLLHVDSNGVTIGRYDSLLIDPSAKVTSQVMGIIPEKGRVWIAVNTGRLYVLDKQTGAITYYQHRPMDDRSLSSAFIKRIYRAKDGTIWIAGDRGVDYFYPDRQLFQVIYPFADPARIRYSRGVTEDDSGNFWFTTLQGIVRYDRQNATYTEWANTPADPERIYNNSSRSILYSSTGDIWFATAGGINRLDPLSGRIDFMNEERHGIPAAFYFSINEARDGTIWFGCRDREGFYYLPPGDSKAIGVSRHPALKQFAGLGGRYFFEDRKGRHWFGTDGNGVVMYDPGADLIKHWKNPNDGTASQIAGNVIVDIKEDQRGLIWISSLSGLTAMDPESDVSMTFDHRNGLTSNVVGPLAIDTLDRIWIGLSNGLAMLDSSRKNFTHFDRSDGLPTLTFPEHPGYITRRHEIVMPTNRGFIVFDPYNYLSGTQDVHIFIAGLEVLDKEYPVRGSIDSLHTIRLKPKENYLTIRLAATNYHHQRQAQYSFKLEGYDREWRVTSDPRVVYTNLPGGRYTFRYRAWSEAAVARSGIYSLPIVVEQSFYKTTWFWTLCGGVACMIAVLFFSYRIRSQRLVLELQARAQMLEKEKAVVKYENLMQHLNPHFLFNSLTALGSLINFDPKLASQFLDKMSKVYRYILRNRDQEVVSLSEEMRFVQFYIDLQKTRFEDGLKVINEINDEYEHYKIAPVTLQNLVENAIKHNISDAYSPLVIEMFVENGYLVVRNNLQRKHFVETSNKQGLENMRSMYSYLSERPIEIIENDESFTVKVPLL